MGLSGSQKGALSTVQDSKVVENTAAGVTIPGFEPHLCHLASCVTSLDKSLSSCVPQSSHLQNEIIALSSEFCWSIKHVVKSFGIVLAHSNHPINI